MYEFLIDYKKTLLFKKIYFFLSKFAFYAIKFKISISLFDINDDIKYVYLLTIKKNQVFSRKRFCIEHF